MADFTTPTPTCTGCCTNAHLLQLNYRLGYIEGRNAALSDLILATLRTPSPAPTPRAGPWSAAREWVERAEVAQRGLGLAVGLWRLWRMVSWPVFAGAWGAAAARWLGLL